MAANNAIASEECCDSDFESDFVPTRVLKTIEVGIDEVTSIATLDRDLEYPVAVVSVFGSYLPGVFNQCNGASYAYETNLLPKEIISFGKGLNGSTDTLYIVTRNGYASNCVLDVSVMIEGPEQCSINHSSEVCSFETDVIVNSVCITKKGQIAVCAVTGDPNNQTNTRRGLVRICTGYVRFESYGGGFQGNAPKDIEFDGDKRLFTYPRRIAESSDGNLWVVNRLNERTGNITVIDIDGKLRFRYNRHTDNTLFDPMDVAANINGSMIIADFRNHLVHLVKDDGTFLQYIMTREHGLAFPSALALDRFDRAWVGCDFGKVHIVRFNKRFK